MNHSRRNRLSPVHLRLLLLLLSIGSVVRIANAEVDSSTAAASNANQQYQTPKEHLTPPPQRQSIRQYIKSNLLPHRVQEPSFIQRVARFFGFDYGRKVYPPPPPANQQPQPPVNTQSPAQKFQSTERIATEGYEYPQPYNTYAPPNYAANGSPNFAPYPGNNQYQQQQQQQPQQGAVQGPQQLNNNQWNPNTFNNYQNNPQQQQQQQQFQNNPNQNQQQQFNNQQNVHTNQQQPPQYNGNNQNQNNQNNFRILNTPPGGSSFPYPYQTYGPPTTGNNNNNQPPAPAPPSPPNDNNYQFQPSQQFLPSFGPSGNPQQQQQQQQQQQPPSNVYLPSNNQPPSQPQVITPPPNVYLPARSPQSARQMAESFDYIPCNKSPWVPMYNGREIVNRPEKFLESTYLGASQKQQGHQNYYPTPPPRHQSAQVVKLNPNANTWAHQVSSDLIVGTPKLSYYTTPSPNRLVTSPEYLPPAGHLPIQHQQHPLVPIPIPNLSVTAIPPLYDYRPFSNVMTANAHGNAGANGGGSQGGGGVTNIIIGTNVGHPNGPTGGNGGSSGSGFSSNLKIVSSSGTLVGNNGGPTSAPFISTNIGYQYERPNQLPDFVNIAPAITNSHAGYQYPKPNVIPDLSGSNGNGGRNNNGNSDPKSQVETVQTTGNAYRTADLYNDFEIIKSIPILQFSTAVEGEPKNASPQGGNNQPGIMALSPGGGQQPEKVQQQQQQHQETMGLTVQPIVVGNQKREEKLTDSYTAASQSHNFTIREESTDDLPINYVTEPPNYLFEEERNAEGGGSGDFEIQPSVQTQEKNHQTKTNERDTPKNLLDSPIFYLKGAPRPFTRDPSDNRIPYQPDYPPSSNTPATMPDWIKSSPFREPSTSYSTTTPVYVKAESSGVNAGMAPPPPPMTVDSINLITKRPKQIQIIIPYTTNNRPHPFRTFDDSEMRGEVRVNKENYEKWVNINQELHNEEESKIITATEPPSPRKTTKFLTKILASSIRDLLNGERDHSASAYPKRPIDIFALQKNIDDWTEQEFSAEPHKASTISLAAKSKTIPDEYLTTTPSMRDLLTTTTDWYDLEGEGEMETTTAPPLYFEEQLQNDQNVAANKLVQVHDNYLASDGMVADYSGVLDHSVNEEDGEAAADDGDYWNKFKLAISPLTQEKVYVVTPQPPWDKQLVFNNADEIEVEEEHKSSYKSPRFVVRPTPGKQQQQQKGGTSYILGLTLSQSVNNLQPGGSEQKTPKPITPQLFGKLGHANSPFDIADHEEIHSFTKRITIVTASPIGRKFERKENRKS